MFPVKQALHCHAGSSSSMADCRDLVKAHKETSIRVVVVCDAMVAKGQPGQPPWKHNSKLYHVFSRVPNNREVRLIAHGHCVCRPLR